MEEENEIERKNSISIIQGEVLYSYIPKEDDELMVNPKDIVTILDMDDHDWWQCEYNGEIGMLPSNYLKILDEKENKYELESVHEQYSSPKPYSISQEELPPGWKMFVEKESGDIYYYNESTGSFLRLPF